MRKIILLLFIFPSASGYFSQIEEVRRITKTLCSPEFHGRGYVNKGDSIAAEFIATEFKNAGLKPIKNSYFQSFKLDVNTFPGKVEVEHNGRSLKPGIHFLVDAGCGSANKTLRPKNISISTALNTDKLVKEIKAITSGKEYNSLVFNFSGVHDTILRKIAGLTQEIAGILPVIEVVDKKFTWSVSNTQLKFPLIRIQDSIYNSGEAFIVNIEARLLKDYTSRNVIGFLPAKKKTKKAVVYTAHYDHLGRMGTEAYFPGANDNASGTAMLISMAKYFKENPSQYNIVFIAFAGEEAGLIGSEYFVAHPLIKLKKIRFLLNLDIMGSGEEGITVVNATLFEQEFQELQKINEELKLLTQVKPRGPTSNSDHYWFTQKGVPAFFIYTMGPNKNYHDVYDQYENLSFVEYKDITTLLVEFTNRLNKK